ncbi:Pycsar system effector family protein [Sphingomonas sp.]|uniref:Pycsar system effector family protein n=1 Tax=Sphingomonas sp. TaxID=28214 RepID=UPI0026015A71|nr:Pycsar system effector family protein [Sphingomonas sp.]
MPNAVSPDPAVPETVTRRAFAIDAVHLIRTTEQINVSLSQMADQKASILMGATFVVFSIAVNQAVREYVSVALVILALFAFMSAMLAVFAIMPSIRSKRTTSPNLLFFGGFAGMGEEEYIDKMLLLLKDPETIYRAMLRDIYQNGQVLMHKKYKFLGLAYRVFLVGLVLTMSAFGLQFAGIL